MASNGNFSQQDQYQNSTEPSPDVAPQTTENNSGSNLSKDEVGWYFVEQYYTTLGKNPEKLHLFYGKRSQFVSGLEAEVSPVSVGRSAIQERIKELDFQECKVRVSNVDSQASFDNIVIQVIGETSTKSAELRKFVQTFVLAQQPSGYFVLNDIFRYINEEADEEVVQSTPEETTTSTSVPEDASSPQEQSSIEEPVPAPSNPEVLPEKATEVIKPEPELTADQPSTVNGDAAPVNDVTPTTKAEVSVPVDSAKPAVQEVKETKKLPDPSPPTAAAPPPTSAPAPISTPTSAPTSTTSQSVSKPVASVQPSGPQKPLSWAGRAAAAVGSHPKPAVPSVAIKGSTPTSNNRTAPAAPKAISTSNNHPVSHNEREKESPSQGSGWQTAGENPRKQNRPQSISAPPEKEGTMGYVRNVTEKVEEVELRATLSSFGNLSYFDINRAKNCAFVEYATSDGYQAAFAASPHQVSGESIYVEPRRPKASAYGGNGYIGGRGGNNQRVRGGYSNRGRGSGASRGRAQANNA